MIVVQYDFGRCILFQTKFFAGFIPKLVTIGQDLGSLHAIHHDTSVIGQDGQHLFNNLLQLPAMTANEDGIGTRQGGKVGFLEVADMHRDAWSAEPTGILLDNGFAFGTNFESFDVEVWELQACFDTDAARTEADVPQRMTVRQIKCLKR